ncbi:MAG: alkaline phosphatase [Bacillota bacterium]|jgi:alkaline phosphatase|nr:alkaline phosphatase [Bacillota bacterium]HHU43228.1 alkaline phosphatase [Clostridiales bacterium]
MQKVIKNKILKIIVIAVFIFATVVSAAITGYHFSVKSMGERPKVDARANNVILLIGDGMGFNHVEIASYFDKPTMTQIQNSGQVTTLSLTPFPTDSAAAATALATGHKAGNGRIAYSGGKKLENLGDIAIENGKKLGIVTTKSVTDATPAAFSAHNKRRSNDQEIALEQIRNTDIDVLLGLGREYFDNYADEINTWDRAYVTSYEDLSANEKEKVYGIFDDPIPTEGEFSLEGLTEIALEMLDGEEGFFLMVEGGKIDNYSHKNDLDNMLKEFWDFDRAVAVALAYAMQNPDTTVIVTADHETGWLKLPKEWSEENINDRLFKSGNHSFRAVPYFIFGPGEDQIPAKIDNTDIFYIINQLLFG